MAKVKKVVARLKPAPYSFEDLEMPLEPTAHMPQNKRGYKYSACRPNPYFKSTLYSTSDMKPYHVGFSRFDRSSDSVINDELDVFSVPEESGWRSARSSVGIREGKWYVEFKILKQGNVRVGIGRREASIEAPVGFDGYAYGVRDIKCQGVHLSKRFDLSKDTPQNNLKVGDVVGLLIELPKMNQDNDIVRDIIPIKYKNGLFFEQFEYTVSKEMDHYLNPVTVFGEQAIPDTQRFKPKELKGSSLKVFVNGKHVGGWNDLLDFSSPNSEQRENKLRAECPDDGDLGYYPMASCFNGGEVAINTSAEVWIPPQEEDAAKPYGLRYSERVIEEYVWDLVDETVSGYLDTKEAEYAKKANK